MQARQHGTPILIRHPEEGGTLLEAIPLRAPPFREGTVQALLAANPSILPVNEIEPAYSPLICLGREIATPAGPIDILYSSPSGYLTLVETKLWDNPEARRAVVGQIIDYAKELARWTFEELDAAVRRSTSDGGPPGGGILDRVREQEPDVDEADYIDTVTRVLQKGELLLLIAGNGIREGVEKMTDFLQRTPHLHFSLALVELALYRLEAGRDYPLLVQPRTIARTSEVTRAIVEIQAPEAVSVEVRLPSESEHGETTSRRKLTERVFYRELAENTSQDIAQAVRRLCDALMNLGLVQTWRASSVSIRLPDPAGNDQRFTVVVLTTSGTFFLGWLDRVSEKGGYASQVAHDYRDEVARLTGAEKREGGTEETPIRRLLEHEAAFLEQVRRFSDRIREQAHQSG